MPQRTFYYKRAEIVGYEGTFEDALSALAERTAAVRTREYTDSELQDKPTKDVDDDGAVAPESRSLLFKLEHITWAIDGKPVEPVLCGFAVRHTPGVSGSNIVRDQSSGEVRLEPISASLPEGAAVSECVACFFVLRNHIVTMPVGALTSGQLTVLLQKLLADSGVLTYGQTVSIGDYHHVPGHGRLHGIQHLKVSLPAAKAAGIDPSPMTAIPEAAFLEGFIRNIQAFASSFSGKPKSREARQYAKVKFNFRIGFEQGVQARDGSVIDDLMTVMPEGLLPYIEVFAPNVGHIRGSKLQLKKGKAVNYVNGTPEIVDVAQKMSDFLSTLRSLKQVPND